MRKSLLTLSKSEALFSFIRDHAFTAKMSRRFIAGETLEEALEAVRKINMQGKFATFDCVGENVTTKNDALEACENYLEILKKIDESGIQANISLKLTELGLDISETLCYEILKRILEEANRRNNFIRIDMESSAYTERTLNLFKQIYPECKNTGVVIQAYLHRSEQDIDELIDMKARVRLCKGAYDEPAAVAFPHKKDVDANYVRLMKKLLKHGNYPGIATHDLRIIEETKRFARENKIGPSRFEFQMLYGIRPRLESALIKEGYNLRIYVPYGQQWFPYFMRRLAERPANLLFFLSSLLNWDRVPY